ncbi:MAG: prepilin-type N-terminal cleavage/methylation domain-containing protein [Planctomycetes bacterium]|nr:prepilin-type N-terminal cleavage/methylation domain-containing protein [Planctomycetota bacterium]
MQTCTVQTHINCASSDSHHIARMNCARRGFTLTELLVVVMMISLFVLMAVVNLYGLLERNTFRAQAHEFVSTMQMAVAAAAESDRKYEVIIDITGQNYILRQITSTKLSVVLEEEIIVQNDYSENCRVAYVEFDDGEFTNESRAKFRASRSGWQYGGKIVLLDSHDKAYSVVVNRINRMVTLEEGEVALLTPKREDEVVY